MTEQNQPLPEFSGYELPDPYYRALGLAIFSWNDFELIVDRAIWRFLNIEQQAGACLTAQYTSVFARLQALISLLNLYQISPEVVRDLKKLQGKMSALNDQRNRIVHDARFVRGRSGKVGRFEVTAKGKLTCELIDETEEDLQRFRSEVNKRTKEFIGIWQRVLQVITTSPQILRSRFPRIVMNDLEKLDQTNVQEGHLPLSELPEVES